MTEPNHHYSKCNRLTHHVCESLPGWPERFLETYRSLDSKYHDESMNGVALDGKWSHVEPTNDLLSLHRFCQRMELTSYSTSFSGIDSPGTSFAQLRLAASKITGVDIAHPSHLYGIVSGPSQAKSVLFLEQCMCNEIFLVHKSSLITLHYCSVTKPIQSRNGIRRPKMNFKHIHSNPNVCLGT